MSEEDYFECVRQLLAMDRLDDYAERACRHYRSVGIPPMLAFRNLLIHYRGPPH